MSSTEENRRLNRVTHHPYAPTFVPTYTIRKLPRLRDGPFRIDEASRFIVEIPYPPGRWCWQRIPPNPLIYWATGYTLNALMGLMLDICDPSTKEKPWRVNKLLTVEVHGLHLNSIRVIMDSENAARRLRHALRLTT